jgi:thiamine-monophosphate kinase
VGRAEAETPLPPEFDLIARYFAPLAAGAPGALGLLDDAALVDVSPGHRLAVTADALVAGVHFFADDPPDLIARKALRVNLSDLAAMGARPIGYFLAAAFADQDEAWLASFVSGLAADQATFGIALMGGDTVATPGPLTLAITAVGEVEPARALRRNAAKAGDAVFVTGTLGDSALGLAALRGALPDLSEADRRYLVQRYHLPEPRVDFARALAEEGLAACGMDVSDGLAADLGHICETSRVGARVEWARLPLSPAAAGALPARPDLRDLVVAGGEDFELLFAAPPAREGAILGLGARLGLPVCRIGAVVAGRAVEVIDADGSIVRLASSGYRHF